MTYRFFKKEKANLTLNLNHKSTGQYVIAFLITVLINTVLVDLIRITNILHLVAFKDISTRGEEHKETPLLFCPPKSHFNCDVHLTFSFR